jgi:hypothetical protein
VASAVGVGPGCVSALGSDRIALRGPFLTGFRFLSEPESSGPAYPRRSKPRGGQDSRASANPDVRLLIHLYVPIIVGQDKPCQPGGEASYPCPNLSHLPSARRAL